MGKTFEDYDSRKSVYHNIVDAGKLVGIEYVKYEEVEAFINSF